MKIAIPSNDGSRMAEHTGQARGFIIYQIFCETIERLDYRVVPELLSCKHEPCYLSVENENLSCSLPSCKQDIIEPDILQSLIWDCDVLLSVGIGPNLGNTLTNSAIEMIYCQEEFADDAVAEFVQGTLPIFDFSRCVLTKEDFNEADLNLAIA